MTEPTPHPAIETAQKPPSVLCAAVFLACSWTWCIGMFFPVYLIGQFGWPGWIAFAIPNCIGAAMVGHCWRRPGASESFVARHTGALRRFSEVTILFHWFFILNLFSNGAGIAPGPWMTPGTGCVAVAAVAGLAWEYSRCRTRGWRWIGWGTAAVSGACIACSLVLNPTGLIGLPDGYGSDPPAGLLYVIPALVLGFLVCPHLDLTFHRVRRELQGAKGSGAFTASFAGVFPVLIGYTLLYARVFLGGKLDLFVLIHIAFQSAMTVGAHMRELREQYARPLARSTCWALVAVGAAATWGLGTLLALAPRSPLGYQLFMSAYALVFPAWLLCEMGAASISRGRIIAIATIAAAGWFFWAGYMEHRSEMVPIGVGIVLAGAAISRLLMVRAPAAR